MADNERNEKSRDIKVTDRRMFAPDGTLKEEYRWLDEVQPSAGEAPGEAATPPAPEEASTLAEPAAAAPSPHAEPPAGEPREPGRATPEADLAAEPPPARPAAPPDPHGESAPASGGTPLELPDTPDSLGKPGILDVIAVIAEPATIYLGEAPMPDGQQVEDLPTARVYIDMLTVLRQKTQGNLSAQEQAVMDDLLYRLQMRYIQKRG